ncbi:uncharacterized protein LOC141631146 [Silene latifolia]|uniref:uncharacterized protein LOC141631146 n=1 Tax=Silene latifolia TaxID=37657 RepID=UPI003D77EFEF
MGGKADYMRSPNVSWSVCCSPKKEGGLGLKDLKLWNVAFLGKYVWWLAKKKDHLWVKWVSHVYMKDKDWTDYVAPPDCSWSWRKITHIMEKFKQAYTNNKWLNTSLVYCVQYGYDWLRTRHPKVEWRHLCWNTLNVPKTSFITRAIIHKRLLTKDRLIRMGIMVDGTCDLCDNFPEDHHHLFSDCVFMQRCSSLLQDKLRIRFSADDIVHWFSSSRAVSRMQKRYIGASYVALYYYVWITRNEARIKGMVRRPECVVKRWW